MKNLEKIISKIPQDKLEEFLTVIEMEKRLIKENEKEKELQVLTKTLSDQEIIDAYREALDWDVKASDKNWIGFARALLKKLKQRQEYENSR